MLLMVVVTQYWQDLALSDILLKFIIKNPKLLILVIIIIFPLTFAEITIESITNEFKLIGFDVPKINVVYVKSFKGMPDIKAVYNKGTITMINDEMAVRVARHEVAHAVSLDLIKSNQESFDKYRIDRLGDIKIKEKFYNLTGDELGYVLKLLRWYYKSTQVEEMIAEDICNMVFRYDVLTKDYIGNPTTEELEKLKLLLGIE